jgi:hypothetical protein
VLEVTFFVNTTTEIFLEWCRRYTAMWYMQVNAPIGQSGYTYRLMGGGHPSTWSRNDRWGREGFYSHIESRDGAEVEVIEPAGSAFEFDCLALSADRIEVHCTFVPYVAQQMGRLFQAICERWPEAEEGIVKSLRNAAGLPDTEAAEPASPVGAAEAERPSKGGRPRNADDDWAFDQIEKGRPPIDVYHEWKERIGERQSKLAEPLDSFKKAMRRRKKETKGD